MVTLKYKAKPKKAPVISAENRPNMVSLPNRVVIALWMTVLLIVGARVALFYPQHNAHARLFVPMKTVTVNNRQISASIHPGNQARGTKNATINGL